MNKRLVWCFAQHVAGICNAITCLDYLDEGHYLAAAAAAALVLLMASLRLRTSNE